MPSILLDAEVARGVDDATASLDALGKIEPEPTVVVVSGASGSGKSSVVNALVGESVVAVSAVRPTTTTMTAVGAEDVVHVGGADEIALTDALPAGVVVVDTPAWDRSQDSVAAVMEEAAMSFVVVTPARYGDEATAQNIAAALATGKMWLIANRLPVGPVEREQIEDAIHERLGIRPFATFAEGEKLAFRDSPLDGLEPQDSGSATKRVLERAAAGSSRRIASALTAGVSQLGKVQRVLADTPEPGVQLGDIDTSSWDAARIDLVRRSVDLAGAFDTTVERTSGNDLAVRIRRSFGSVDSEAIATQLGEWRDGVTSKLLGAARTGFRKKSGEQVVIQNGWVAAIDPEAPTPRRFSRMLKGSKERVLDEASRELIDLLEEPANARRRQWNAILSEAGEYKPGELLAAANAFEGRGSEDA